jgi:hypothetical protein
MFDVFGTTTLWVYGAWVVIMGLWLFFHWARRARRVLDFGTSDGGLPHRTSEREKQVDDERRRIRIDR